MQIGIARHNGSDIRPVFRALDQFCPAGIIQEVKANFAESLPDSLARPQDVVVRLMLKPVRTQGRAQMLAQKLQTVSLIRVTAQPHPDQVNVVGHQAIGETEQSFPRGGVQHDFAKLRVEGGVEPAGAAQGHRHGPVDDGVALIMFPGQAWQIEAPVGSVAGEGLPRF